MSLTQGRKPLMYGGSVLAILVLVCLLLHAEHLGGIFWVVRLGQWDLGGGRFPSCLTSDLTCRPSLTFKVENVMKSQVVHQYCEEGFQFHFFKETFGSDLPY